MSVTCVAAVAVVAAAAAAVAEAVAGNLPPAVRHACEAPA